MQLAQAFSATVKTFTSGKLGCYTHGRSAIGQTFRNYRGSGNIKDNRFGWQLWGIPEASEEGKEMLRMVNHQFKAKCENH